MMNAYQKAPVFKLFLIAGILIFPFAIKISLLLLIVYLAGSSSLNKPSVSADRNSLLLLLMPVSLYLLYILSLLYTENISHGIKDLETKAALIIIPLVILFYQRKNAERDLFSFWFIVSMLLTSVFLIIQAFFEWQSINDKQSFYYDRFSDLMHPTYFTMCLTLSAFLLIERIAYESQSSRTLKYSYYFVLFVFVVSMYLTSSRAGLTIGWFLIAGQMMFYLIKRRVNFIPVTLFAVFVFFSVTVCSSSDSRFKILISEVTSGDTTVEASDSAKVDVTPVSHRLTLYKSALHIALDNPLGVGVGDVQDELVSIYKQIGYTKAAEVRYNPHNQFLQTAVAVGWLGMLILLAFLSGLFIYGYRNEDMPLAGLAAAVGLNALFESVFEVQRGVLLFAFSLLFLFVSRVKNQN